MRPLLLIMSLLALDLALTGCPGPAASKPAPQEEKPSTAHCSQDFVDSCIASKDLLDSWSTGGTKAADDATVSSNCRTLLSFKTDFCQMNCNDLSSASSSFSKVCPTENGKLWSGKSTVESCKTFQRRGARNM